MGITTPLAIFSQTIFAIEFGITILGNGFIIAVKGHQWLQNWKMAPCDFLLIILSTSRILLQLTAMVSYFLYYNSPLSYMRINDEICAFLWMFLSHVSLWCATWLNIFYCVKITNFPHHLFLWLKLRIDVLAPRLLGMVIIALMLFSVPPTILYFENKKLCNLSRTLTENASLIMVCHEPFFIFRAPQLCSLCMSFILSVTASMVLLISLWRHRKNLKKSGSAIKDLSTQVYLNLIKSLLFSLLFDVTYFASLIIPMVSLYRKGTNSRLVVEFVLSAVPSAHSMILILSNPKMKEILMHILHIRQRAT